MAIRVARRAGIVDRPGALKVQEGPVAYLGGVAVLTGLLRNIDPSLKGAKFGEAADWEKLSA